MNEYQNIVPHYKTWVKFKNPEYLFSQVQNKTEWVFCRWLCALVFLFTIFWIRSNHSKTGKEGQFGTVMRSCLVLSSELIQAPLQYGTMLFSRHVAAALGIYVLDSYKDLLLAICHVWSAAVEVAILLPSNFSLAKTWKIHFVEIPEARFHQHSSMINRDAAKVHNSLVQNADVGSS